MFSCVNATGKKRKTPDVRHVTSVLNYGPLYGSRLGRSRVLPSRVSLRPLLSLRLFPKPSTLTCFSPQRATDRPQLMASRSVAGGHTLPPNPEFLDFERTDGDAKKWPTNTNPVVDTDGNVNYMKPLGPDDSSDIYWRCQIASKVAERLGKPCTWPVRR